MPLLSKWGSHLANGNTDNIFILLIPATILLHLTLAPYTKVEESFNIQATHDILTHGIPWPWGEKDALDLYFRANYDHLTFSGSVPRTFVGPVLLAGASWPFVWIAENILGWHLTEGRQLIVRAVLGLFNASCMIAFRSAVAKTFGRNAANWYAVFQASGFHVIFYASRTLPNFVAFGFSTHPNSHLFILHYERTTDG